MYTIPRERRRAVSMRRFSLVPDSIFVIVAGLRDPVLVEPDWVFMISLVVPAATFAVIASGVENSLSQFTPS
jgi:hypothetical protein